VFLPKCREEDAPRGGRVKKQEEDSILTSREEKGCLKRLPGFLWKVVGAGGKRVMREKWSKEFILRKESVPGGSRVLLGLWSKKKSERKKKGEGK